MKVGEVVLEQPAERSRQATTWITLVLLPAFTCIDVYRDFFIVGTSL